VSASCRARQTAVDENAVPAKPVVPVRFISRDVRTLSAIAWGEKIVSSAGHGLPYGLSMGLIRLVAMG
jgi:hypothetical protein